MDLKCTAWRQTLNCDPKGPRDSLYDKVSIIVFYNRNVMKLFKKEFLVIVNVKTEE